MNRDQTVAVTAETQLEKVRARYGLLAVVVSNLAIAAVAIVGVWLLNGDKSVIVGVLTAAFTAVSSMTTAYLGIKAVSNTARSLALSGGGRPRQHSAPAAPPDSADPAAPGAPVAPKAPTTPTAPVPTQHTTPPA
ncbi:hypothetical protein [Streptomyces sp. NPDC046759]|uniref:hypothetical protein n=1 Tax=Streptomyces sp. NPDC046759 TaxID=3155019 RepID=UPI003407507E